MTASTTRGTFTVVERRPISDDLAQAADRWLTKHRLDDGVDESWLELVCEDGDVFTPENFMLHLAVPPCEVAAGDSLDVSRTRTVGELWPGPGAPSDAKPKALALARTFERRDGIWVGTCELPAPVRELFTVDAPETMLSVMTATRRTLNRGVMSISGDPHGRVSFTLVEGNVAAWASTEARVPEAFTYWLDARPAVELATPLKDATQVVVSLGGLPDLIIKNEQGVEARCPIDEDGPTPTALPDDYFENQPHGRVEGISIERQGGLGREALVAIAERRPREVTFLVADDASLVISDGPEDPHPMTVGGPGFGTVEDRRNVAIVVPYVVALAIHDGAPGGTVELTVDDRWGRLHRADQGVTVEWSR